MLYPLLESSGSVVGRGRRRSRRGRGRPRRHRRGLVVDEYAASDGDKGVGVEVEGAIEVFPSIEEGIYGGLV